MPETRELIRPLLDQCNKETAEILQDDRFLWRHHVDEPTSACDVTERTGGRRTKETSSMRKSKARKEKDNKHKHSARVVKLLSFKRQLQKK